jgi:hypothetical protein
MLTGDALFTSLHVAREVGICRHTNTATLKCSSSSASKPVLHWEIRDKEGALVPPLLPFDPSSISSLSRKYNLLATEADFSAAAAACDFDLWSLSQCVFRFTVFLFKFILQCRVQILLCICSHEPSGQGQRCKSHSSGQSNNGHAHVR